MTLQTLTILLRLMAIYPMMTPLKDQDGKCLPFLDSGLIDKLRLTTILYLLKFGADGTTQAVVLSDYEEKTSLTEHGITILLSK